MGVLGFRVLMVKKVVELANLVERSNLVVAFSGPEHVGM